MNDQVISNNDIGDDATNTKQPHDVSKKREPERPTEDLDRRDKKKMKEIHQIYLK